MPVILNPIAVWHTPDFSNDAIDLIGAHSQWKNQGGKTFFPRRLFCDSILSTLFEPLWLRGRARNRIRNITLLWQNHPPILVLAAAGNW
jgi:hypothetical protein